VRGSTSGRSSPSAPASARSVWITTPPPLLWPITIGRTPSRSCMNASAPASVGAGDVAVGRHRAAVRVDERALRIAHRGEEPAERLHRDDAERSLRHDDVRRALGGQHRRGQLVRLARNRARRRRPRAPTRRAPARDSALAAREQAREEAAGAARYAA
jgi:hypothetical protein